MSTLKPLLNKEKPIALRLPEEVRIKAWRYATEEDRPASNFVRQMFLRGLADYERERASRAASSLS